ncbi:MAG: glycosyltransferase, partial [Bacteroidales bacterium]|nr:glycosyltransferase [Bacteroidales bacterium]
FSICDNTRKKGAQGARNTGILKAQGEWILLFDSDDVMHSDYLEKMVPHLNAGQNIVVCYGQMIEESSGKRLQVMKKMESGNIYRKLLSGKNYLTYNCSLIKKKCFIQIGLLDENCPSHQEWDTHVRLSSKYEYTVVPEVLWDYFVGREDTISFDMKKHVKGLLYIIRKNYFIYRFQAYRSFLIRMRNLWVFTKKFEESKMTFRLKILFLYPELPIY